MAGGARPLQEQLYRRRTRDGETGVLEFADRTAGPGRGVCARGVSFDDAGWKDAARAVYPHIQKISGGMEGGTRSLGGRGVEQARSQKSEPSELPSGLPHRSGAVSGCSLFLSPEFGRKTGTGNWSN